MVDDEVLNEADHFTDIFTGEGMPGAVWALLWLIVRAERPAVARAIIGDKTDDAVGAESLKKWAAPQLVALMKVEDVTTIPWIRVVRILRKHLPPNKG